MKLVQSYNGGWLETLLSVTALGSYNDYFLSVSERSCAGYCCSKWNFPSLQAEGVGLERLSNLFWHSKKLFKSLSKSLEFRICYIERIIAGFFFFFQSLRFNVSNLQGNKPASHKGSRRGSFLSQLRASGRVMGTFCFRIKRRKYSLVVYF